MDTLGPLFGYLPFLLKSGASELVLTYSNGDAGVEIVTLWMNEQGAVLHESAHTLPDWITFAYVRGSQPVLITRPIVYEENVVRHAMYAYGYDESGTLLPPDTIFSETINSVGFVGQTAYTTAGNELVVLIHTGVWSDTTTNYLRLIRYSEDTTRIYPPWPAPISNDNTVVQAKIAEAGDERGVVALGIWRDYNTELRLVGYQAGGFTDRWHAQPLMPMQTLSGSSITVGGSLVYGMYAANALLDSSNGGVFLFGFPTNEVLDADSPPEPLPKVFTLTAFPNPFNAVTRISYALERPANVTLLVFDVAGRLTERLYAGPQTAGEHAMIWNASGMPSGTYWIQLRSGGRIAGRKLVLIK